MTGRPPEGSASELAAAPPIVADIVGDRTPLLERYAAILATRGLDHGLVGPREVPRLWERHIVNCALLGEIIPQGAHVIDVGSGAGLPGLVLAVARPDLRVDLVEPLERRVRWLDAAVAELGLGGSVGVHRGKAQAFWGELTADLVTARAVARLADLTRWCLPLVPVGGALLAMKGESAARELEEDRNAVEGVGGRDPELVTIGAGRVDVPTRVIRVTRGERPEGFEVRQPRSARPTGSALAGRERRGSGRRAGRRGGRTRG